MGSERFSLDVLFILILHDTENKWIAMVVSHGAEEQLMEHG